MTEKGICPIQTVFGILGGKWKHRILLELHPGPMRYNQLAASIGTISYKVLTHSSSGNWRKIRKTMDRRKKKKMKRKKILIL